jgi:hypothetical protein
MGYVEKHRITIGAAIVARRKVNERHARLVDRLRPVLEPMHHAVRHSTHLLPCRHVALLRQEARCRHEQNCRENPMCKRSALHFRLPYVASVSLVEIFGIARSVLLTLEFSRFGWRLTRRDWDDDRSKKRDDYPEELHAHTSPRFLDDQYESIKDIDEQQEPTDGAGSLQHRDD